MVKESVQSLQMSISDERITAVDDPYASHAIVPADGKKADGDRLKELLVQRELEIHKLHEIIRFERERYSKNCEKLTK
jgi:hypothetical protein